MEPNSGSPQLPGIDSAASMFEFLYNVATGPDLSVIARYMSDCFTFYPEDGDYLLFIENHIRTRSNSPNALAPLHSIHRTLTDPWCIDKGLLLVHYYAMLDRGRLNPDRQQDDWVLENLNRTVPISCSGRMNFNEDKRYCVHLFSRLDVGTWTRSLTNK